MRTPKQLEEMFQPAAAARRCGISRATIFRLMRAGKIYPIYRPSARLTIIPASALDRFMKRSEVPRTVISQQPTAAT